MAVQTLLDECLSIRGGRLFIEECDADELARQFGTPCTVMSEDQLRRNARRYRREFEQRWPAGPVVVLASIKANFALATRWILSQEGLGCDTFGAGELDAALEGGVPPDRISVNGAIKDQPLIEAAVRAGARITRGRSRVGTPGDDSLPHSPGLLHADRADRPVRGAHHDRRGHPAVQGRHPHGGHRAGPAGPPDAGDRPGGGHAHIGRHTNRTEQWPPIIAAYGALLARLREAWNGWTPRELNLGGGYPVPRDPFGRGLARLQGRPRTAPDVSEYAGVVTASFMNALQEHGFPQRDLRLEIEPGRGIYGDAGVHLATVRNIKAVDSPAPHRWVETDTSDMFLPDVVWEHNRWTAIVANKADRQSTIVADIVGLTCQPDRIVPLASLPDVEPGDSIAFLDTGAYQDGLACNFNALPRPGMVLVTGDRAEWIKRPETLADLFRRDVVPPRLTARQ